MNAVNKTLYIPLYGKAYVSRRGLFLKDPKAEEIWSAEGFPLKGKAKSKWLAFYMGIRSAVFDDWTRQQMARKPDAVVIHLGCGMDSRCLRVDAGNRSWFDVDFPEVIAERKRYYAESDGYHMIAGDVRSRDWLDAIPEAQNAVVIMEGISMYLTSGERKVLMENLCLRFENIALLADCYSKLAAKMSRYKNPIHDVGVSQVYGMDDPNALEQGSFVFVGEHAITPQSYIHQLTGLEKQIFRKLYAGGFAQKLYRLFEYRKE